MSLVEGFLTRLVRLFPAPFRERFGEDMEEQVRRDWQAARGRGPWAAAAFAASTAADLVRTALRERRDPSFGTFPAPSTAKGEGDGMIMGWVRDLRQAGRALARSPGFTVVSVATLGLAVGANAGIFSVVDAVVLDPLPYAEADRLVAIAASAPGSDMPDEFGPSAEFHVQYAEGSELLEDVATYVTFTNTLRAGDRAERVRMSVGTPSLLSLLGAEPLLGRLPVPEDEEGGVMVISHALWTTWFEADPAVVGRAYHAGGDTRTVIGVMGPDFWFPNDQVLLWIPFVRRAEDVVVGRFGGSMVGRLRPGAELAALTAELDRLAGRLPERFGGSPAYARLIAQHRSVVRPLKEEIVGATSRLLWILLGAVGVVLLIACANVANLFLVRGEHRQRDLSVRRALGADRRQLLRGNMAEALVVAALSAGLAIVLAWVSVPLLVRAAPPDIPRLGDVHLSLTTIAFTFALSVGAALLCGLVPAVRASAPDLARLRDESRGSTTRGHRGRDALVVAQTTLALVLLIGSALLLQSFRELRSVDPGYDTRGVFTFQIAPEGDHLTDGRSYARFHMDFMERIAALPGVASVGIVENVPLDEGLATARFERQDGPADGEGPLLSYTWSGGDYFATMDIGVLEGRPFVEDDHVSSPGNVVVSREAADLLWPGESALGRRLRPAPEGSAEGEEEPWHTVVGVVEDVMQYGFRGGTQPLVYLPLVGPAGASWVLPNPAYVVKTARLESIGPEIRAMVQEVAPGAPMYRVYTMEGLAAGSMVGLSFAMVMLGVASALALFLGTLGLYGVLSYVVAQRTREIGVRMALGAEAGRVQAMVVAQGARVVGLGVALGLVAAFGATRLLGSLLFGVGAVDVPTFLGMAALLALVGLLASWLPARQASGVDPIRALGSG